MRKMFESLHVFRDRKRKDFVAKTIGAEQKKRELAQSESGLNVRPDDVDPVRDSDLTQPAARPATRSGVIPYRVSRTRAAGRPPRIKSRRCTQPIKKSP